MEAAALTGFGVVAWGDFGVAGEEVFGQLLDAVFPVEEHFRREWGADEGAALGETGKKRGGGVADMAGEEEFAGFEAGEDEASEVLITGEGETGIEGQLHVLRAGKLPGFGRDCAGFVVNDQDGLIAESVEAVEAQAEGEAGDGLGTFALGFEDLEGDASGFVVEPGGDQAGEALLLELQVARGHAVAEA